MLILGVFAESRDMLRVGDHAPEFAARLSGGKPCALSDFFGKKNVVLFFYPADFTPGCTKEVCTYRDNYAAIERLDATLLGVSANDDSSHARFSGRYQLPFPLIADTDRSLAKAYHVLRFGGLLPWSKRVTFVIDKQGIIRLVSHHELAINEHLDDVIETLKSIEGRGGGM